MIDIEQKLSGKLLDVNESVAAVTGEESAAAVLILFVNHQSEWNIVFTRRTENVRTHQGEVSFPGGAYEPEDISLKHTALRETEEEIGIRPDCIRIIGRLNPVVTISNYIVNPFVGILECDWKYKINNDEVERVFLIPITWLMDEKNRYEHDFTITQYTVKKVIHYLDYDHEHVWGLTARITKEVLDLI